MQVKNHSPFVSAGCHGTVVSVSDKQVPADIPSWYVAQMQLEMLCIGPQCRSAVMVRLSATCGAVIMRMQRSDDYIELMLKQFAAFYGHYVIPKELPPPDFLRADQSMHERVTHETLAVSSSATLVAQIQPGDIQRRRPCNHPLILPK